MHGCVIRGGTCLETVACAGAVGGGDASAAVAAVHGAVVLGDRQCVVACVRIVSVHSHKPAPCSTETVLSEWETQSLM